MKPLFETTRALALLLVFAATACSSQKEEAPAVTSPVASEEEAPIPVTPSPYDALPDAARALIDTPFTGDFDAMVARRTIRVGVTFNRTHYFIDKGQERGLTFESLKLLETDLNADLKTGLLKVHVVIVPMTREQLYPALTNGVVDMVAAMVTVTPEREKLVSFSEPTRTNVSEVVVIGPGAPPIGTVDDLAGQEVFVRKGSIYDESLVRLNAELKARGKPPVVIVTAPDVLEDDDVLEMVNAGHGEGTERRRYHPDRSQRPRWREVHAVHDRPVLQGRAHGRSEQGADDVRVIQCRTRTHQTAST